MRLALALALALAAPTASAQSVWTRPWERDARRAHALRVAAGTDALLVSLMHEAPAFFGFAIADDDLAPDRLRARALARAEAALALDPDDVRAATLVADLLEREPEADHERVRSLAAQALARDPDGPEAANLHFTRALASLRTGRFEEARDAWHAALAAAPSTHTRAVALGNLGDTYMVLRDARRAVDAYREAAEVDADNELAWLGLGVALDRAGLDATAATSRAVEAAAAQVQARATGRGGAGAQGFEATALLDALGREEVFFNPEHERYYHEALAWEAVAREHLPGGRAEPDARRAEEYRRAARAAWERYLRECPADDPWRPRAASRVRAPSRAAAPR